MKDKITDNGLSNSKCEIQMPGCKNHDGRHHSQSITFQSGKNASICASCLKKKLVTNWTF